MHTRQQKTYILYIISIVCLSSCTPTDHGFTEGYEPVIAKDRNGIIAQFPLYKQFYKEWKGDSKIFFRTKELFLVEAQIGISCGIELGATDDFYIMFQNDFDTIINRNVRNSIVDIFNRIGTTCTIDETCGNGQSAFLDNILTESRRIWDKEGLAIHRLDLLTAMKPPSVVIAMKERILVAKTKAEDARLRNEKVGNELGIDIPYRTFY